ncbi:ribosomal protein S18 acetylase RimI-like enzyme [Lederbergia galactosidilyticus]|uniref:GNAT family N-acetyltransferase n=1 Tax=Lederbergia galactosidilytica TaxID=217031 RepID=UPI001AE212C2|nr:GNAT family N-acetyltransferase [Lederbergia galactosidilytica]MBP1916755.1 ribosomal protein S18 acetylase RimI-like enzyme [Lederbergia galactosidilytica]
MNIISLREHPEYKEQAIKYFQSKWADENSMKVYEDSITHSITTDSPLPIWYLMEQSNEIIGCAGLISNDFISRMDLWPWLCALYIDEDYRGRSLGEKLILRAKADSERAGFNRVYLCTDHTDYYEKYGFNYIGDGYHPWGSQSRIYASEIL